MKRLFLVIFISYLVISGFTFAQPGPGDWDDAVETIIEGSNFDAVTNELGSHLILCTGSELHYYLIGNDGEAHLDNTLASGGEWHAIAAYDNNVYVI